MNVVKKLLELTNKYDIRQFVEHYAFSPRYHQESKILQCLVNYALNKDKNKDKEDFEKVSLEKLCELFKEENEELLAELTSETIDYTKVLEEVADCAAMLTGIVAYVLRNKGAAVI